MAVSMFITLAMYEFLLAFSMNFLSARPPFPSPPPTHTFCVCMNNHVPTCPGMKLNLDGPKELYSTMKKVLMNLFFWFNLLEKLFYWRDLVFVSVYLVQVYTCTFLASWYEEQKEVKMAQGAAGTNEDKVNSNV